MPGDPPHLLRPRPAHLHRLLQGGDEHPALPRAGPDGDRHDDDQQREHDGGVRGQEVPRAVEGAPVPDAVQRDGGQEAEDGRDDPLGRGPRRETDAEAEAGRRREQRVGERAHHAAQDDGRRQRGRATLPQRGEVVEDVLHEGEADADERAVDDAVEQAVDLLAAQQHDGDQEQSLPRLLDDRGHDRERGERLVAGDEGGRGLEREAEDHRDDAAPADRGQPVAGRLGLVAVEPEDHQQDQREGERREERDEGERTRARRCATKIPAITSAPSPSTATATQVSAERRRPQERRRHHQPTTGSRPRGHGDRTAHDHSFSGGRGRVRRGPTLGSLAPAGPARPETTRRARSGVLGEPRACARFGREGEVGAMTGVEGIDDFDIDRAIAQAWAEFGARLAEVLSMVDESGDLTIGTPRGDGAPDSYLRFSSPVRDRLRCVAGVAPTPTQDAQVAALLTDGWERTPNADRRRARGAVRRRRRVRAGGVGDDGGARRPRPARRLRRPAPRVPGPGPAGRGAAARRRRPPLVLQVRGQLRGPRARARQAPAARQLGRDRPGGPDRPRCPTDRATSTRWSTPSSPTCTGTRRSATTRATSPSGSGRR